MNSTSIKQALLNRRMLICIFTGFASGMPLYLLISLVPAWLRSEGVGLKEIGFFALIGLPYTWKFFWSPLLDRYRLAIPGLSKLALLWFWFWRWLTPRLDAGHSDRFITVDWRPGLF